MSVMQASIGAISQREKSTRDKPLRVLIVGGHTLFREGLRRLLGNSGADILVVGEAAHRSDAIKQVTELTPDILILDLAFSKLDGLEVLRSIRGVENVGKIILTAQIRREDLHEALELGVKGVVLKRSPLEELIRCIRWIAAGRTCIEQNDNRPTSALSVFRTSARQSRQGQFHISHREIEILEAVVAGSTNRQIASRFRVSVHTVKHHVTNLFDKTGASNRLELALFAVEKNLVDNPQLGVGSIARDAALLRERSA